MSDIDKKASDTDASSSGGVSSPDLKHILIVEDEKLMARALEVKLNRSGFKALAVHDGKQALQNLIKSNTT